MNRTTRILLAAVAAVAVILALAVAVFGVVDLITQLINGTLQMVVTLRDGYGSFTMTGNGMGTLAGRVTDIVTDVRGAGPGAVALHITASVLVLAAFVTLALIAAYVARALLIGRPFTRTSARLLVITDLGLFDVSSEPSFDPLLVVVGIGLLLVALAFRAGTRMQRDTEGLV